MSKIFKDGVTQDSVTGQIYQVGRSADAIDPPIIPVAPVVPTSSNIYNDINYISPEDQAFIDAQNTANRNTANTPIDENAIRTNTLSKFQSQIDALNRVYAEKKATEQLAGAGRMGGVAAVGARRGLLGSDFGIAQENNQTTANTEAVNAIESERLAKETAILTDARTYGDAEIAKKEAARKSSSEDYLKYIADSSVTKKNNIAEWAKRIYASGVGDTADFQGVANSLKVSVESLKNAYNAYKKEQDAVAAEKLSTETAASEKAKADKEQALLKDGYTYVKTPAERDALKAKGYQTIELGGRTYSKIPKTKTSTVKVGSTSYSITTDEMGNVLNKTVVGSGGSGGGSGVPGKFNLQDATAQMSSAVDAVKDKGTNLISKEDWATLMSQWMQKGGTAKSFADNFKQYTNPADNYKYVGL